MHLFYQKLKTVEGYLKELKDLEKELQEKKKIETSLQAKLGKEYLLNMINKAIEGFSEIGYLDKVAEVYQTASNIFSIAASKSENKEFSRRAEMVSKIWSEKAALAQASIGLRPDLKVTAETVKLLLEARPAIDKGIEWLKQSRKESTGGWGWVPWYLSEDTKRELTQDQSFTRAYDTAMAIEALLIAEEKPDQQMISEAINWLEQNRDKDGGWGPFPPTYHNRYRDCPSNSNTHDTSYAIIALLDSGKPPDSEVIQRGIKLLLDSGRAWRELPYPVWCDYIGQEPSEDNPPTPKATSLALVALLKAGKKQSFDSLVRVQPHGFQRAGRGWERVGPGRIQVVGTSYALIALSEGNEGALIRQEGIKWLKRSQNDDGGWRRTRDDKESEIEPTALAIIALLRADESSKDITIRNGVKWLLSKQSNNNWNSYTSLVILALHDFITKPL